MYNKLVITIVDEKGSRQFQAHKHIKKIIFWGIIGLIATIISSFFFMKFLMHTIEDIAMEQNIAVSEYRYIYQQNENLKTQIQQKTNELDMIHQRIGDLETIIDTQKNNQKVYKFDDIDLESLDNIQKDIILDLVPNGDPVENFNSKTKTISKEGGIKNKTPLGVEYAVQLRTPIYAASDGVVEIIRTGYKKGFGNFIRLNHSFGFSSVYAHLDGIEVKKGDFVKKGELIGYSGNSGNTQKAVLYYEVLFLNKPLDTERYTEWSMENFDEVLLEETRIDWKSLVWIIRDILKLQDYQNNYNNEKNL